MASPATNAKPPRPREPSGLRSTESSSASRGAPKSRGSRGGGGRSNGGGGGGGRGPRSSGGDKAATQQGESQPAPPTASAPLKKKDVSPARSQQARTPSGKPAALPNDSTISNERLARPKAPSRRGSRAVPSVVVSVVANGTAPALGSTPAESAPPTPSRPNARRHRSSQQSTTGKGPTVSDKGTVLTPSQKPRGSSTLAVPTTTPAAPLSAKDAPPHLVKSHDNDMRHALELMVEGVRARAMENRPHTPGSHIDWAGDEDDSLPDLDDWGVKTESTHTSTNTNEISPILVDTLKTLPELQANDLEKKAADADPEPVHLPPPSPSTAKLGRKELPPASKVKTVASDAPRAKSLQPHPSLPAKPVAAVAATETLKNSRNHAPNGRAALPPKPVSVAPQRSPLAAPKSLSPPPVEPKATPASKPSPLTSPSPARPESGLEDSIHAPKSASNSVKSPPVKSVKDKKEDADEGTAASIYAPKNAMRDSSSAPALSPQSAPSGPRSFSPVNGHSVTESRSPRVAGGLSNHRSTRSGATSPLGKSAAGHARNHSSPAGPGHRTRPVISGEGFSRLARAIAVTPRPTISVVKD